MVRVFHHDVPLMLMSYLGTAKTWLFGIIFHFWRPGLWSLRLPVVLIGALTLYVFYRLVARICDSRTAFAATMLVATDASFVLTTTFDWGPVAIQHLAYVSGLLFVVSGHQRRSALRLGAGFLMFGLGMWDKAIFIWILSGSGIAALVLFAPEIKKSFTLRNVLAATVGFVLGALPLVIYNIRNPLKTFQGNAVWSTVDLEQKLELGPRALSGSALFGYVVNEASAQHSRPPGNVFERGSLWLGNIAGGRRSNLYAYAFLLSLLAAPFWRRRWRPVLFALIAMAIAWAQMLFTKDAGTGLHHSVLLWPLPHLVIAVALVETARRIGRAPGVLTYTTLGVLCLSGVLVINQYLGQFIRYGAAPIWTEAVLPAANELPRWADRHILMTDWGMDPTLCVLNRGNLKTLWNVSDTLSHDLSAEDRDVVRRMFLIDGVFVMHTPEFEILPGSGRRLMAVASELGYQRRVLSTVTDSFGHPAFEIAEFSKK